MGITSEEQVYEVSLTGKKVKPVILKADIDFNLTKIRSDITYTDFDESIISFDGNKIIPLKSGETFVTVHWNGYQDTFLIRVSD